METEQLLKMAWLAREDAYAWKSGTKVGCAIECEGGFVTGWNVEGLWMTSIHAEVLATAQLAGLGVKGKRIAIVSDTSFFTPCGACLDWLVQFCDWDAEVIIQNRQTTSQYILGEMIPNYPRR